MTDTQHPRPPEHEPATDPWLLDRLLAGPAGDDLVDDGDAALAELFAAMTAPPTEADLVGLDAALAAFVAHQSETARSWGWGPATMARSWGWGPATMARRLVARPAAVLVASAGVLTAGAVAAAAYGGVLPPTLQDIAHHAIGAPAAHQSSHPGSHTTPGRPESTHSRGARNPASTSIPGPVNTPGPPATNPAGKTPGEKVKETNPAGKTPGEKVKEKKAKETNPAGKTPGEKVKEKKDKETKVKETNPAGKTPGDKVKDAVQPPTTDSSITT